MAGKTCEGITDLKLKANLTCSRAYPKLNSPKTLAELKTFGVILTPHESRQLGLTLLMAADRWEAIHLNVQRKNNYISVIQRTGIPKEIK